MGTFDGAALVEVAGATPTARAAGLRALAADLDGRAVGLAGDRVAWAWRPPGSPVALPVGDELAGVVPPPIGDRTWAERFVGDDAVVVLALTCLGPGRRGAAPVTLAGRSGETAAGSWRVGRVAVLPPVPTDDLRVSRPLEGQRTHLGLAGEAMTLCGRLPLADPRPVAGVVDCLRCLRSGVVVGRHDAQLGRLDDLVALAGRLPAATAARLWLRLGHRDAGQVPALLDAMVGAIAFDLPGAPAVEDVLVQARRHREVASAPVRAWVGEVARGRLADRLPAVAADHPVVLDAETRAQLVLAGEALDAAEAAELLVAALEEHGPAPALEPVALRLAERAGDRVSERVGRWRRIQRVAASLAPAGDTEVGRGAGHGELVARARARSGT